MLAIVGLWSTIVEESERRTHEFAIRSALGAGPRQLLGLVLREGALTLLPMVAIGGSVATMVVLRVRPLLFNAITAIVPLLAATAVLSLIMLLTACLPALNLRHVSAAEVLRATR